MGRSTDKNRRNRMRKQKIKKGLRRQAKRKGQAAKAA
jgi:hypothetical protein